MKYTTVIIALSAFLLSSCTKNYQARIESLKTELALTGDTILAYSLDKHFAVWVHADTANMIETHYEGIMRSAPNVYYYDLDKEEKELLFKSGDSLFCKSCNRYEDLSNFDVGITPDSLGLEIYLHIEDCFYYLLYPLSKRDTVFEIVGQGKDNSLIGLEKEELEITEELGFSSDDYMFAAIEVHYNGNGDIVFTSDSAAIYGWGNEPVVKFPKELLENTDELRRYIINSQAYSVEDVYREAGNEVSFKEYFENYPNYFKLTVTAIKNFNDEYRVDGKNFSFFTKDKAFAQLSYPNKIIVKATVSDIRIKNSLEAHIAAQLDILSGGWRNPNADFMFKNCELMYYSK